MANIGYNCLGYAPAPILYGFISKVVDKENSHKHSRIPMAIILYSVVFVVALVYYTIRRKHK